MHHEFGSTIPGKLTYDETIKKGAERAVKFQKAALPLGVSPATKVQSYELVDGPHHLKNGTC